MEISFNFLACGQTLSQERAFSFHISRRWKTSVGDRRRNVSKLELFKGRLGDDGSVRPGIIMRYDEMELAIFSAECRHLS